jgi:hypothetical protein
VRLLDQTVEVSGLGPGNYIEGVGASVQLLNPGLLLMPSFADRDDTAHRFGGGSATPRGRPSLFVVAVRCKPPWQPVRPAGAFG